MKYLHFAASVIGLVAVSNAASQDNPFKNARVGDWAEYKMTTSTGGFTIDGKIRMEVTVTSNREVRLKTTATVNGLDVPIEETLIDLTKPYDPSHWAGLWNGTNASIQKAGDGEEKITVGGKHYQTTWQRMKMIARLSGFEFEADTRIWRSKTVPLSGMVKLEMNSEITNMEIKTVLELTGFSPLPPMSEMAATLPPPSQCCVCQGQLRTRPGSCVPIRCRLGAILRSCRQ